MNITNHQETIFELMEDFLWFVFQYGAPAPEEMRSMLVRRLEGGEPSETEVTAATLALRKAWEDLEDEGGMTGEEIPGESSWIPEPWMMEAARAERIDRQLVGRHAGEVARFYGYDPEDDEEE